MLHHTFHASTTGRPMPSMRGLLEPSMIGGPPARTGRGSSTQSSTS